MDYYSRNSALIALIRAYINGLEYPEIDYEKTFEVAKRHSLGSIYYLAIKDLKDVPNELSTLLRRHFSTQTAQQMVQEYYSEKIMSVLDEKGIRYMPLKGYYMRRYYPLPEMRTSCDIDIFYDFERENEVNELMSSIDFYHESHSDNDDHWSKEVVSVETHFKLIAGNKMFEKYYENAWDKLILESGSRYVFTPEDFYIYMMVHSVKHFVSGGFGIRTVLDVYYYLKNVKLDREYLNAEFEKLKMSTFVYRIERLATLWFDKEFDGDYTDEEEIGKYIIESGVYGTETKSVIMRNVSKNNAKKTKSKFLFRMMFPSYKDMCLRYKFLKKVPILLPFMWPYRWVDALITRRHNVKTIVKETKMINEENVNKVSRMLELTKLNQNDCNE